MTNFELIWLIKGVLLPADVAGEIGSIQKIIVGCALATSKSTNHTEAHKRY